MSKYKTAYFVGEVSEKRLQGVLDEHDIVRGSLQLGTTRRTEYSYVPSDTYITIAFEYYCVTSEKKQILLKGK